MSDQAENRRGRGWVALVLGWALLVSFVAAGCGGSGGDEATVAGSREAAPPATPAPCELGKPILAHVPEAPASWKAGPGSPVALTCSGDRVDPGAAIAGYATPAGGSCVSAYSSRLKEAFGELCRASGSRWTAGCDPRGCVHYFGHRGDSTILAGPVSAKAEGVWVEVNGKQALEGVMLTTVRNKLMRAIGAKEPFGFFGAYLPRCREPGEVRVHVVAADGTQLGVVDGWDGAVPRCSRSEGGGRS